MPTSNPHSTLLYSLANSGLIYFLAFPFMDLRLGAGAWWRAVAGTSTMPGAFNPRHACLLVSQHAMGGTGSTYTTTLSLL